MKIIFLYISGKKKRGKGANRLDQQHNNNNNNNLLKSTPNFIKLNQSGNSFCPIDREPGSH